MQKQMEIFEQRLQQAVNNLMDNVSVPVGLYFSELEIKRKNKKRRVLAVSLAVVIVFVSMFVTIAVNDNFIPGFGLSGADGIVTHSIEKMIIVEKDGYTHKIFSAYVSSGTAYIKLFFYKTDIGIQWEGNTTISREEILQRRDDGTLSKGSIMLPEAQYAVRQNGKWIPRNRGTNNYSINLQCDVKAKKGEDVTISIYNNSQNFENGEFLTEISMVSVAENAAFAARPSATVNGFTLSADCNFWYGQLEIYIGALLPRDVPVFQYSGNKPTSQFIMGYEPTSVFLRDGEGNIYMSRFYTVHDPTSFAGFLFNIHYFDVPEGVDQVTLVIPEIKYQKVGVSELLNTKGPWEIKINLDTTNKEN